MTPEGILAVVSMYEARLTDMEVSAVQMDGELRFSEVTESTLQSHALYLCGSVRAILQEDADKLWGKANRHFTALQMILSFLGWYTLNDLREHNRPDGPFAPVPTLEAVGAPPE